MPDAEPSATCSMCGTVAAAPPVTWMREVDPRRGAVWVCDRRARENVRGIEGRLDREWW